MAADKSGGSGHRPTTGRSGSKALPNKRIVVLIDILGFSDLIKRMRQNVGLYYQVKELLETVRQEVRENYEESAGKLSRRKTSSQCHT